MTRSTVRSCLICVLQALSLASACAWADSPPNKELSEPRPCSDVDVNWKTPGDMVVIMSISGGGKRASAYSYGVMSELQKIQVETAGKPTTLLHAVDFIAGVSGGAVPAVFYKLNRDAPERLEDFEEFLYDGTEGALEWRVANPVNWWSFATSSYSRTDLLAAYFDRTLFSKRTFGDLPDWPYLIINATDLASGQRFNFTQFQFNCIGSDLKQFPLAYAVAASAAYPVFFPTLTLRNFNPQKPDDISPFGKEGVYVPLSDGGLVDNYATAVYLDLLGRGRLIGHPINDPAGKVRSPARGLIFIQINASAQLDAKYTESTDSPWVLARLERAFGVASTEQIRSSHELFEQEIISRFDTWKKKGFCLSFVYIPAFLDDAHVDLVKNVPTRWTLDDAVIKALVEAGRQAIRDQSDMTERAVELLSASDQASPVCR